MFCIFGSFFNFFSKHLKYFNVCRRVSCCVSVCEKKTFPRRSRKAVAVLKVFCRIVSDPQATIRGNNCLFVGKGEQNESLCPFRAVNCSVTSEEAPRHSTCSTAAVSSFHSCRMGIVDLSVCLAVTHCPPPHTDSSTDPPARRRHRANRG